MPVVLNLAPLMPHVGTVSRRHAAAANSPKASVTHGQAIEKLVPNPGPLAIFRLSKNVLASPSRFNTTENNEPYPTSRPSRLQLR